MKTLTRKQVEDRKAKAVRFTRDVLGDDDRADEIEQESLEHYAEGRHIGVRNPKGATNYMAVPTRRELLERISELEEENEGLQERLDEIADLAGEEEEEGDEQGEE